MEHWNQVSKVLGLKIYWKGKGINEKAVDEKGNIIVVCHKTYYRPLEVNSLLGDAKKAKRVLNWKPKISLNEMISEMIELEPGHYVAVN